MKRPFPPLSSSILIGFILLLGLTSCSSSLPKVSPPKYLSEQITRNPPGGSLTAYRLNGPYGGATSSLALHGNAIVVRTTNGRIYWSRTDNLAWSASRIESNEKEVISITSVTDQFFAATDNGILQSSDDGVTWKKIYKDDIVTRLVPFQNRLLAAGSEGILRVDIRTGIASSVVDFHKDVEILGRAFFGNSKSLVRALTATPDHVFLASSRHIVRSLDLTNKKWDSLDSKLGLMAPSKTGDDSISLTGLEFNGDNLFALLRKRAGGKSATELFVSTNFGDHWEPVQIPATLQNGRLFNSARGIFLADT